MEHGLVAWFLDRCRENFRVVREAPEAFAIMAIVIAVIVYFAIDKLHAERFAELGERVAFLNDQVNDYRNRLHGATPEDAQKEIQSLTRKLNHAEEQIYALQHPPREENSLYQNGEVVAHVLNTSIDRNAQIVHFSNITEAARLKENEPFEFRDMRLQLINYTGAFGAPGAMGNFNNVTCHIIGKRD